MVLKLIQPYTRIRIPFISKELNIPEQDVEQLLVSLILDSRISGHIDQVRYTIPSKNGHGCYCAWVPTRSCLCNALCASTCNLDQCHLQVNQLLELSGSSQDDEKYEALGKWSANLKSLHNGIVNKLSY